MVSYRANGVSSQALASGTTSISLSKPSGVVENDIMLAVLNLELYDPATVPTGWALVTSVNHGSLGLRERVYWKRAGASESGPYEWTCTSQWAGGSISTYSGVTTSGNPWEGTPSTNSGGPGDTATFNSVTTSSANAMLVAFGVTYNTGTRWSSWTSPITNERVDLDAQAISDGLQASPGASGSKTAALGAYDGWCAIMLALEPEYLVYQGFEGTGFDNGETWVNYGGDTGAADPDYATSPLRGSQSLRMKADDSEGTYAVTKWGDNTGLQAHYGFFRLKVLNLPPGAPSTDPVEIFQTYNVQGPVDNPTDTEPHEMIWISSTGVLSAWTADGAIDTGTTQLAEGTVYYVWYYFSVVDTNYLTGWVKVSSSPTIPGSNELEWTHASGTSQWSYYGTNGCGFTTLHTAESGTPAYEYVADQLIIDDAAIGDAPFAGEGGGDAMPVGWTQYRRRRM